MTLALLMAGAYLLGSVPFGMLVARGRGIDLRAVGSGNIGATNVWRALGPGWALVVFALDFGKGVVSVLAARALLGGEATAWWPAGGWVLTGVAAIVGHTFPVFAGFHGGRGAATGLGTVVGLHWPTAVIAAGVWGATLWATRIVSVSTLVTVVAVPITMRLMHTGAPITALGIGGATLIFVRHISNIRRLLRGEEPRIGRRRSAGRND